jgi:hypothetical protein
MFLVLSGGLVHAQPRATAPYTINGIVRDEASAPLSDAEVTLSRGGVRTQRARTGTDGRFSFDDSKPGDVMLNVRRLGYKTASKNVTVGETSRDNPVNFDLQEIASDLDAVVVEGSMGHLQEFYDHKANNNFGKFFERKEIEKRNPVFLSELLRTVPGAALYASDRSGNRIFLRDCRPVVWVDGMRAPGAELDDVARPMDTAGLEVYTSSAGLPPQYQDRNNRMCGAIVVWTKNQ